MAAPPLRIAAFRAGKETGGPGRVGETAFSVAPARSLGV